VLDCDRSVCRSVNAKVGAGCAGEGANQFGNHGLDRLSGRLLVQTDSIDHSLANLGEADSHLPWR
jgi:hypothetical protein